MDKFDNPQNTLNNVIHIAGTNGKGSTAAFLKEISRFDSKGPANPDPRAPGSHQDNTK